jgi:glycosyltransferase involved in cell wall biosynthesis
MPVFNGQKYLREALDSICCQSFSDFELIISDNASTDETGNICKQFEARDSRIKYYRSAVNVGAADNYNRVVELSRGEYFKWAAHDDICEPAYLEKCVSVLDVNPDVVLSYPKTKIIDQHGKFVRNYDDGYYELDAERASERFEKFHRIHGLCNPIFGLIRRNALINTPCIGKYPSSDRVLLGELVLLGKFYEVPEHLFQRRSHLESSLGGNPSDEEIARWFDTKKQDKVTFPRWRRFWEYLKCVNRVKLDWGEKLRCYGKLLKLVVAPVRLRGMLSEGARLRHLIAPRRLR